MKIVDADEWREHYDVQTREAIYYLCEKQTGVEVCVAGDWQLAIWCKLGLIFVPVSGARRCLVCPHKKKPSRNRKGLFGGLRRSSSHKPRISILGCHH